MQQKQTFSAQTLTLSVAAAELGRAIFGAGQTGSVRAVLLSNVLAAGRCISSEGDAWEVTRVIPVAALTGEAAGTAAALAAERRTTAAELPYVEVQQAMRKAGNPTRIAELYP